jgi:hypothetical protein
LRPSWTNWANNSACCRFSPSSSARSCSFISGPWFHSPRWKVNVLARNGRGVFSRFLFVRVMPPRLANCVDLAGGHGQGQDEAGPDAGFFAGPINPMYFHASHSRKTAQKPLIDNLWQNIDLIDNRGFWTLLKILASQRTFLRHHKVWVKDGRRGNAPCNFYFNTT